MIDWRRVPWPLWVYSAVVLFEVISLEVKTPGPIPALALYVVIMFGWLYFLLNGRRWVWIVTLGIYALGLVFYLISSSPEWQAVGLTLIGLLLLLLPVTRRFFLSRTVAPGA
jgi:hypothetical protein